MIHYGWTHYCSGSTPPPIPDSLQNFTFSSYNPGLSLNSFIRNKPCVESRSYYRDGVMNGVNHHGCPRVTINVGIISPSGWSPWLILASYNKWNVSWLAFDDPHTTNNVNGIHTVSPNQVTPSWLRGSGVSLLFSDSRLPPLGQRLWTEASPLRADVGCLPPRRLGKLSKEWTSSILPWNRPSLGFLDASSRRYCQQQGGCTYKAPHKDSWPPASESLTSTIWHGGGILSNFGLTTVVATPDCKSLQGWAQRGVTPSELLTAYDMPVDEQTHVDQAWRDK
jgi:hypothetical protein